MRVFLISAYFPVLVFLYPHLLTLFFFFFFVCVYIITHTHTQVIRICELCVKNYYAHSIIS